jgi:hypothetical protein
MSAPLGNNYWQFRNKHGRSYKYTPRKLWTEALKYFQWVEDTPLWEEKGWAYKGVVTKEKFFHPRAMTEIAFCLFADIDQLTFERYKKQEDFCGVTTRIEKIIRSQKFEGAAAELFNPNIIARDLGLREKTDHDHTGELKISVTRKTVTGNNDDA